MKKTTFWNEENNLFNPLILFYFEELYFDTA